jgi:hypothetical protein
MNAVVVARTEDCPRSCVVGLPEIAGDESPAFTMIMAAPEVAVIGELERSVTCSSTDHVPTVVSVPVEVNAADDVHAEEPPKLV